jgi:hypothetical protein
MRPISELVKEAFSRGLRFGTASALRASLRVLQEARTLDEAREVHRRLIEQDEAKDAAVKT